MARKRRRGGTFSLKRKRKDLEREWLERRTKGINGLKKKKEAAFRREGGVSPSGIELLEKGPKSTLSKMARGRIIPSLGKKGAGLTDRCAFWGLKGKKEV